MKIKFTTVNSTSRYNANLIRSLKTQRGPVSLSFLLQELKITCCKLYSLMGCRKHLKVQMEGIFFFPECDSSKMESIAPIYLLFFPPSIIYFVYRSIVDHLDSRDNNTLRELHSIT